MGIYKQCIVVAVLTATTFLKNWLNQKYSKVSHRCAIINVFHSHYQ